MAILSENNKVKLQSVVDCPLMRDKILMKMGRPIDGLPILFGYCGLIVKESVFIEQNI